MVTQPYFKPAATMPLLQQFIWVAAIGETMADAATDEAGAIADATMADTMVEAVETAASIVDICDLS